MSAVFLETLIIIVLVIANGLFAMSEIAVISARRARLQQQAEDGAAGARVALKLGENPGRFLSTVQIGITLIGVLAGALGGATLSEQLAAAIARVAWLAPYSDAIGIGVVVLVITYLSLVIGELVPKRLALNDPERIAAAVARPMQRLSVVASPAVHLLTLSTDALLRLLRARPSAGPPVTEDEIRIMMEQGTEAGVFEPAEQDIVERVFRMGERRIEALMTPRTEIEWLDADDPVDDVRARLVTSVHSYFPVARGSLDRVLGIAHARAILAGCLSGAPLDPAAVAQTAVFVPESAAVLEVLALFKRSGTSIALVLDEFGGVQGLITMTDILEAIVGDLPQAGAPEELMITRREDGSWLLDGLLPVDEMKDVLRLDALPDEGRYQTLSGLVMAQLGRIPSPGDAFELSGLRFEVVDMDGRRVDKVWVVNLSVPGRA